MTTMPSSATSDNDRLVFTLILAAAVHAIIILGVKFSNNIKEDIANQKVTISIRNEERTSEADFLAATDQEGSGEAQEALELSSAEQFMMGEQGTSQDQLFSQSAVERARKEQWISGAAMSLISMSKEAIEPQQEQMDGSISSSLQDLEARVHKLQQEYAKRPRIRTLTSVSTKAASEALYLEAWRNKVERVGNAYYPQEAKARKLFGELRLKVSLNQNGRVLDVKLLKSSGSSILDNAAKDIVRKAAPFDVFPNDIRKHADQLDIIRTWRFEPSGRIATQ